MTSNPQVSRNLLVGVDVGGTKTAVLVADKQGNVLSNITRPTLVESPEGTLQGIVMAITEGVAKADARIDEVAAIGLGIPGRVDPFRGVVRKAVHLGWHELPVGSRLSAQLGVPCVIENDVRTATIGLLRSLGKSAPANLAYVSIGTGIAVGLIFDGRLYRGSHFLAGELGHMVVEPDGPECACGAKGCLETLVAGPVIARLGKEASRDTPDTLLAGEVPVTTESVYAAAGEGDPVALAIVQQVGKYLALALQQLIMVYDVEFIYIGGGVSRNGRAFLDPVLQELARLREGSTLNGEMIDERNIRVVPAEYNVGVWGAVALASDSLATNALHGEAQEHS